QLLENCQLNINTVSELSKGKQISYLSFAKIADYLDCSVDYLLGRSTAPNVNNNTISNQDTTISGTQANVINNLPLQDEMILELVKAFQGMNFVDKMEIMNAVLEKAKK
ncbi:MAG: hypothetical protein K2O52_00150, partial [Oscillospiraceae bacterium]|nr:hypothetical protein [Oscillospiraceae bacterium]